MHKLAHQSAENTSTALSAKRPGARALLAFIACSLMISAPMHATAKRLWIPIPVQKALALKETDDHDKDLTAEIKNGAKLFERCNACHAVGKAPDNGIGPHLDGIIGRRAASVNGYDYSPDMTKAGKEGLVWTPEFLSGYLKEPETFLPETKMAFSGIDDDTERAALIAYLGTLKPRPDQFEARTDARDTSPPDNRNE